MCAGSRSELTCNLCPLLTAVSLLGLPCAQEVSVAMIGTLRRSSLGKAFHVVAPADASAVQNQNSVVLLRRSTFPEAGVEITDEVRAMLKPGTLSPGDLILLLCKDTSGVSYLIASFHGDSDGKATLPVLAAISVVSISKHADAVLGALFVCVLDLIARSNCVLTCVHMYVHTHDAFT